MNIVKQNRIRFKRISDPSILGYEIKAKQIIDDEEVITLLAAIDNIQSPNPIKVLKKVDYNSDLEFLIEDDVFWNDQHEVSVYINGRKLIDALVTYLYEKKLVSVLYNNITEFDIIEIEYFYDGMEYFHNTSVPTEYFIDLIIDRTSNNIGDHNVII
jgi:hypothetical protein